MIWKKITINTSVEATDIVASVLFDNGIVGVEIEDNQNLSEEELKKMYVDIPKINVEDGKAKVIFYVSICNKTPDKFRDVDKNIIDNSYMRSNDNIFTKDEFDNILLNIKDELKSYDNLVDVGSLVIEEQELDDSIFLNKWRENFKSLEIGNINILPNWEKPKNDKLNILIEPGSAFGTGQHSTTRLCVKAITKLMSTKQKNINFLDIGTGSGILSIIAYKLGANKVVAIDVDENCEMNILENLKLNGISSFKIDVNENKSTIFDSRNFIYGFGNIIQDNLFRNFVKNIRYDIIVANILAPVIVSLIEKGNIKELLNDGGSLVLSGIIKDMKETVINSLYNQNCFNDIIVETEGDWVSIVCKKGDL